MFKTELHCHSSGVSPCSTESVESLLNIYKKAGYSTIILTNHYSHYCYDHYKCNNIGEYVDLFFSDFEKMKKLANEEILVLYGAELRVRETPNDYLCFGITEEFLRNTPQIFDMKISEIHEVCKQNGWLLVQAHPFRNYMQIIDPTLLDGVEVYNGHTGHKSRNFIANSWADEYGLIKTSGTDLHYASVPATGGIETQEKITSIEQLVQVLKSGNYKLLTSSEVR
jgi:hypothetical protein